MKNVMRLTAVLLTVLLVGAPALADDVETTEGDETQVAQQEVAQAVVGDAATDRSGANDGRRGEVVVVTEDAESGGSLIAPFSLSLGITDTFNLGAIFRDPSTVTNYNLLFFNFNASWATPVPSLALSISASLSKYTTTAGGLNYQYESRFGDIPIGLTYGSMWADRELGLNLSGFLTGVIPTSDFSRFSGLYTRTTLGFNFSGTWGRFTARLGVGVRKNWNSHTTVAADEGSGLDLIARDGGTENLGEALIALQTGVLSEWGLSNSASISYNWFPGFSTSIGFSFNNDWTYDNGTITADDDLTPPDADPGRGHGQTMTGSLSVSYAFLDYFSASWSMSTTQPPKTADNQSIRFPWFDFETGNLALTTMAFSVTASY